MKLKNKQTGEIGYTAVLQSKAIVVMDENAIQLGSYTSLAELNEEWEDYEEPKEYWYINEFGTPTKADFMGRETLYDKCRKNFGNYFETEEETEKAAEKLKAWKRLKDGGITFKNWTINQTGTIDCFATWGDNIPPSRKNPTLLEDLDLLFGGEE